MPDPKPLPADTRLLDLLSNNKDSIELRLAERKKKFPGEVPDTESQVRFGDVASGAEVVSSPTIVQVELRRWRKLVGIEMETYAVHRACADAIRPSPMFLSCKAVSDSASHKDRTFRKFAAWMSAAFLDIILEDHLEQLLVSR